MTDSEPTTLVDEQKAMERACSERLDAYGFGGALPQDMFEAGWRKATERLSSRLTQATEALREAERRVQELEGPPSDAEIEAAAKVIFDWACPPDCALSIEPSEEQRYVQVATQVLTAARSSEEGEA